PPARWERSPGEDAMSRRLVALALLGVVVVVVGAYGVRVWRYWDRHVSTDDAFVESHISPVSARVRGTVVQVLASDNQQVPAGALGAARRRLDMARAEVAQAEAEVASQEVALAQAGRQREAAEAGLGDARSRRGEVTIRSAETASAQAKVAEARAALQEAELN